MKHIIEFDTNSENFDQFEYKTTIDARKFLMALNSIVEKTREWVKYDERNEIPVDEIRREVLNILREEYIDMEEYGY